MNRILPLLLLALSSSLLPLRASTYFASPDGGGDGSSVSSPTTLQSGLKKLAAPGDTLYLLSGQYNLGNTPVQNLNGSASKRIVIAGYEPINRSGKYAAILDFRNTPYGTRGLQIKASTSYLHVKNLTLRYSGKNNLYNEGSFNLFENLDIYGSADTGCQMKGGGDNIIRNVDSHDNFDYKTMSGSTANFGGNADGFADKQFTGNGNHYIGCRAWNNSDDGWDFFQRVSSSNTLIEYSVCFRNGPAYYDMTTNPRVQTDKDWFESVVGTQLIDRYGNTITVSLDQYPCQGNGNGFKMGGQYTDHKVIVHHCLAVDNNARGFDQNNNGGTMWLYNNSAYRNVVNYGFTTAYGTNALQNNISFAGKNGDGYKSQSVIANDHNSWNTGFSVSKSDFQSLDTVQILAPRNGNSELPDGTFMHLTEGSQLIDRGIDVNLGYNGYAPDLGCYEYPGEHHDPDPGEDTYPAVQPEGTHAVAFVTLVGAAEDKPLLNHLRADERLWVNQTDATDPTVDYSGYELIVLGAKPNSGVAGFAGLKGYAKPMVLLKPFLLKNTVWDWGTPLNTADLSVTVTRPEHPIFQGLTITDGQLNLFAQCNTNAVTAITSWTNIQSSISNLQLASPVSAESATSVAELPAGTDCNGTVLTQPLIMIGVSEYSTLYLTTDGKQLIANAVLYLLGLDFPTAIQQYNHTTLNQYNNQKYIQHGNLFIQTGDAVYDAHGARVR